MKTSSSKTLEVALRRYCTQAGGQLQAVCLHALAGGGRTRANLLLRAAERKDEPAIQAACALEMMHAATLLQDDIFDGSAERRGRRAAYLQFGEAQAVLASDWLLLRSLELASEVHPDFFRQLASAARNMASAVAKELDPPFLSTCTAARSYIDEICQGKTASLFAVALHGAASLRPEAHRVDARRWAAVGNSIGCTYQLLDDCLDVYAPEGALNKSTGVDLRQGRLTLPLLAALQALQAAGHGVSIDRFQKGKLTGTQLELLEQATADERVRTHLKERIAQQMREVERSAQTALLPREVTMAALKDMGDKVSLCFAETQGHFTPAEVQYEPVLAV